jgi:DNA-binding NarL/FixJ family response regulator
MGCVCSSDQERAQPLVVAKRTIKEHFKHVYGKQDAHPRSRASCGLLMEAPVSGWAPSNRS